MVDWGIHLTGVESVAASGARRSSMAGSPLDGPGLAGAPSPALPGPGAACRWPGGRGSEPAHARRPAPAPGRRPCRGSVSGAVPACRLVAGGGHLYDSRVRRCRSRPCCVFGLQGPSRPQELCAGTLPGLDAGRVRDRPPSQSLRGRETGWAGGQRNRSHPGRPWPGVLLSVAFWKPGRTDV
jgi:hypothetical protein